MNMQSFKEFAAHKDGTYVAIEMSEQSKQMLDRFVEMSLGLVERVDPSTYHCTVIYSRTPVPAAIHHPFQVGEGFEAKVLGYEVFPTKNDGKCLVMRLHCPAATNMNAWLTDKGATSDYDDYKPHTTLAYDTKQEFKIGQMPIPAFSLIFDKITVTPLEKDYVPANK